MSATEFDTRREWISYLAGCLASVVLALPLLLVDRTFNPVLPAILLAVFAVVGLVRGSQEHARRRPGESGAPATWPWWANGAALLLAVVVIVVVAIRHAPVGAVGAGLLVLCAAGLLRAGLGYRNRLWD